MWTDKLWNAPLIRTVQAFVVRKDTKSLTEKAVETLYHFHVSLQLNSFEKRMVSIVCRMARPAPPPTYFVELSKMCWTEEATKLEQG